MCVCNCDSVCTYVHLAALDIKGTFGLKANLTKPAPDNKPKHDKGKNVYLNCPTNSAVCIKAEFPKY